MPARRLEESRRRAEASGRSRAKLRLSPIPHCGTRPLLVFLDRLLAFRGADDSDKQGNIAMKIISTALLAAGFASLAACGGGGANNAAAANNSAEAPLPPEELGNGTDLNSPSPVDTGNTSNTSGNATASNASTGNVQ